MSANELHFIVDHRVDYQDPVISRDTERHPSSSLLINACEALVLLCSPYGRLTM